MRAAASTVSADIPERHGGRRGTSRVADRSGPSWRDDRGAGYVAAFIVLFGTLTLAGIGVLVDTARIMSTHRQTDTMALEAARAGANAVDAQLLRSGGGIAVDPGRAQAAASVAAAAFVSGSGASISSVSVDGDRVTVRISATVDPWFPIMSTRTVSSQASATAATGIGTEAP
ncbi:hypothetical protein [Desertimonas flava]|uniref:hypothetical protein n=1 Tax=Desertimonas flava TaxID=2064846 RepID=UPI000E35558D|nr:hypothetical protein [Desertimonas flava]